MTLEKVGPDYHKTWVYNIIFFTSFYSNQPKYYHFPKKKPQPQNLSVWKRESERTTT